MFLLRKALAFIRRDFLSHVSYRFAFLSQSMGIVFRVATLFFGARLLANSDLPFLERYDNNIFAYILIGIAFVDYLHVSMRSFSESVRYAQLVGTLEALLVTQTDVPTILFFSSIYPFLLTTVKVALYLLLGVIVFGLELGDANYFGALIMLALTIVACSSIGLLSASFVMVLKKGDPFNWVLSGLAYLVGGVLYPPTALPAWLQKVSYVLPITPSREGMRMALLNGHSIRELLPAIFPLLGFIVLVLPGSLVAFSYAVKRAKIDGSLTHF